MAQADLTQALAAQLTQFTRELSRARRGVPRGVHQARVASRRLREGVGALEALLQAGGARKTRRTLREVTRALGAVRECDVTLALLETEAARHQWPTGSVAALAGSLRRQRQRAQRALIKVVEAGEWREGVDLLKRRLRGSGDPDLQTEVADGARQRRRRRARALLSHLATLGTLYVPDHLHAVRLASKKLRYALEWERDIGRRAWTRERQMLERVQDQLGEWHDRLVLQEQLHRLRRTEDGHRLTHADFRQMAAQLERECRAGHAAILARRPALTRLAKRATQ